MTEKRHPGITMHKLSFGSGFMSLLFAAGSALIFVLGFPTLWYFVGLAVVLGASIAVVLRLTGGSRSNRNKPLSIINTVEMEHRKTAPRKKWHRIFQVRPATT